MGAAGFPFLASFAISASLTLLVRAIARRVGAVSMLAAIFLGLNFFANHQMTEVMMLAVFAGALLGFLLYNRNPASIFMGDCGSMFIGFFLASSALLATVGGGGRSRSVIAVLAV